MKTDQPLSGRELKAAFANGENITALLRKQSHSSFNSEHSVETAYDLQSGSYVAAQSRPERQAYQQKYAAELVQVILKLGGVTSLLEAGVGEATTLTYVLEALDRPNIPVFGVDLCWSRLRWARRWLQEKGFSSTRLAMAKLGGLPFADASIDIVYTSHAIEPNGGREEELLAELHRVTARYLILLEPSYENASPEGKARMKHHGYCMDIPGHAERLGMKVLEHRPYSVIARPENPTAITIIEKDTASERSSPRWSCPECRSDLKDLGAIHYCETCLVAFPSLSGIPCLRQEKGIIASQLLDDWSGPEQ